MRAILRLLAPFVLGLLVGAAVMTVHTGRQVEELMYSVRVLDEELAASRQEAEELRESLRTERRQVITGIRVDIHFDDELTSYEERDARLIIEKQVKEWLNPLYGSELETVDPRMVPRVLDGRDVAVDSKRFRLKTRIVFVAEEVVVFLNVALERPEETAPREFAAAGRDKPIIRKPAG